MVCNVSDGCGAAQGWWKLSALQISWSSLSLCWWLAGPLGNLQTSYCWVGRTNQIPVLVAVSQWGDSLGGPAPGCSLSRSSLQSDGVGGGEVTCNRPGVEISVITVITSDTQYRTVQYSTVQYSTDLCNYCDNKWHTCHHTVLGPGHSRAEHEFHVGDGDK